MSRGRKSLKSFLSDLDTGNTTLGSHVVEGSRPRYAHHTTITSSSATTSTSLLPPSASPLAVQETTTVKGTLLSPPSPPLGPVPDPPTSSSKTQTSEILTRFMEILPELTTLTLDHNDNPCCHEPCPCGRPEAFRTTKCYDCTMFRTVCTECYIDAHKSNPTHWAEVWDPIQHFFVRHDISRLRPDPGYATQIGHHGGTCPNPRNDSDIIFLFIDTNGIHNTKVRFCGCDGSERYVQLMKMGFFPGSLDRPTMAFSFRVLRQFHLLHFESKTSAYDFIGSLRRLTDNAFAQLISDPYPQFRRVMRIWRILQARKRLGQFHGIDTLLPHRPTGNLIVYCPACPEPGVNMEEGWERTPTHLRHLNQLQQTADGNHHANKYIKNTDPDDISLFGGTAYFPDDKEFRQYLHDLKTLSAKDVEEEKTTCAHLNAVNKQNRRKFKNMDITGIVNIQCAHVLIQASVDMQLGETFGNTDYALAHALHQRSNHKAPADLKHVICCDHLFSYDISCAFSVHVLKRFKRHFADLLSSINKIRWLIPLVHVTNHKDNCNYLFSSAYITNAGHFHGETAEQTWPELNQLGAQTRQMNNGHRQDTLIDHHGDWNFKKVANMSATLYSHIQTARQLFIQKREAFKSLSNLYAGHVSIWDRMDRDERRIDADKEVMCVYRQSNKKVPSQSRVYQKLLTELDSKPSTKVSDTPQTIMASYLNEGLLILQQQRKLRSKIDLIDRGSTVASDELEQLRIQIDEWRQQQKLVTPQVGDYVLRQTMSLQNLSPEEEILFLPSDFSLSDRVKLDLVTLANYELELHKGTAYDCMRDVRTLVKVITSLRAGKKAQAYGQTRHTRASEQIRDIETRRDFAIANYNAIRGTMISLGLPDDSPEFPPLTLQDTFRKPTNVKRGVGDSRRIDGAMWTNTGVSGGVQIPASVAAGPLTTETFGTQGTRAKRRGSTVSQGPRGKARRLDINNAGTIGPAATEGADEIKEGWIWSLRPPGDLSDKELDDWTSEGDRVQWFRAEAEMQRWQEELERTQADFLRTIRFFATMHRIWHQLAESSTSGGAGAYARKTAAMFWQMEKNARHHLDQAKHQDLVLKDGEILADIIQRERDKPENVIRHPQEVHLASEDASDEPSLSMDIAE